MRDGLYWIKCQNRDEVEMARKEYGKWFSIRGELISPVLIEKISEKIHAPPEVKLDLIDYIGED